MLLSQHPVDLLIRDLISSRRYADPDEVARIIDKIAHAPFDAQVVTVQMRHRGTTYGGTTLGAREDRRLYHLTVRVVVEHQWEDGTTLSEYLADLRGVVALPNSRIAIYERRGGFMVGVVGSTYLVIPRSRRGNRCEPLCFVAYSADRGKIITGYQFTDLDQLHIPENARWIC